VKPDNQLELLARIDRLAAWLTQLAEDDRAKADEHAWHYAKLDRYDDWEASSVSAALSVCRARAELADRVARELRSCVHNHGRGG
jgi:hypothetical protein